MNFFGRHDIESQECLPRLVGGWSSELGVRKCHENAMHASQETDSKRTMERRKRTTTTQKTKPEYEASQATVAQKAHHHFVHKNVVLDRLNSFAMTVKITKCEFAASSLEFLGHELDSEAVSVLLLFMLRIYVTGLVQKLYLMCKSFSVWPVTSESSSRTILILHLTYMLWHMYSGLPSRPWRTRCSPPFFNILISNRLSLCYWRFRHRCWRYPKTRRF